MSFNRLVRFVPASDSKAILIGEPVDTKVDVGLALRKGDEVEVKVFSGKSALNPGSLTDKTEKIARLLSPLSQEEVGTIRCIGLNVSLDSIGPALRPILTRNDSTRDTPKKSRWPNHQSLSSSSSQPPRLQTPTLTRPLFPSTPNLPIRQTTNPSSLSSSPSPARTSPNRTPSTMSLVTLLPTTSQAVPPSSLRASGATARASMALALSALYWRAQS